MNPDNYIKERVDDQIIYYDTNSKKSQNWYKVLTSVLIISGALIPFISGFSESIYYSEWITASLGLGVTCSAAFLSLNKYQERWITYRTTCETLKHLKNLFITKATPYKDDNAFDKFVNDIESIISKENSDWSSYIRKQSDNH